MQGLHHFLTELKRRHVYRVAGGYVVAAWLVIQVAATALPYLHAPEPLITIIIIAALAGFPVALILAWLFEVTPGGVHREQGAPSTPAPRPEPVARPAREPRGRLRIRPRWERLGPVLAGVAAVSLGGWLWNLRAERGGPTGPVPLQDYQSIIERQVGPALRKAEEMRRAMEEQGRVPTPPATPGVGGAPAAGAAAASAVALEDSIAAGRYRTIAVLPFVTIGDAGQWRTGLEAADSMRARIGRDSRLEPISAERIDAARGAADVPANAGFRFEQAMALPADVRGDLFVTGNVVIAGGRDGLVLSAQLHAGRDGRLLRSTHIIPGPLPRMLDQALRQLLGPAR